MHGKSLFFRNNNNIEIVISKFCSKLTQSYQKIDSNSIKIVINYNEHIAELRAFRLLLEFPYEKVDSLRRR